MTADDYKRLHALLIQARNEIATSAEWCEQTSPGLLADADWQALGLAEQVVHRLYLWRNWPPAASASYLPALPPVAVPHPQSLRVAHDPSVA